MNGYTSGTQALQGRKVNHDPEPWAYSRTSKTGPGPFGTPDRGATRIDGAMMYFPRPEFLVRDNPILAAFRAHVLAHRGGWAPADATQAHVDHAIRVFQKLAALNA